MQGGVEAVPRKRIDFQDGQSHFTWTASEIKNADKLFVSVRSSERQDITVGQQELDVAFGKSWMARTKRDETPVVFQ